MIACASALLLCLAPPPPVANPAGALMGAWAVDLRSGPSAPPYIKTMRLESAGLMGVAGSFYDSPIRGGRINAYKGRPCFAFTTADQSGPYFHTGCLQGDRIEGTSYSESRGFLLNWTAERQR